MGQEHRLRVLEMRAPGHRRLGVLLGLGDEDVDGVEDETGDLPGVIAQVHPSHRRDLVIARPSGPQLPAELGPGDLDEPPLERGVDVLVGFRGDVLARGDPPAELVECRDHPVELVCGEQSRTVEDGGVRLRSGDVVRRQAPIEVRRLAQRGQRIRRSVRESSAPQAQSFAHSQSFRAVVTTARPVPSSGVSSRPVAGHIIVVIVSPPPRRSAGSTPPHRRRRVRGTSRPVPARRRRHRR